MNLAPSLFRHLANWSEAPPVVVLLVRVTALLALAWMAHAALARRNPRWRVALWRATAVGLAAVLVLAAAPPVVTWPVPRVEARRPETAAVVARSEARPSSPAPVWIDPPPVPRVAAMPSLPTAARSPSDAAIAPMAAFPPAPAPRRVLTIERGLIGIWLAGVLALAARLGLSMRRMSHLVARSSNAPEWALAECEAIAARLGVVPRVRLAVSDEVSTPCLAGLRRPVVLLPSVALRTGKTADLQAILAHELAHARGRDLLWNFGMHVVSVVLWVHPLAWRIRGAHATACDHVCDAIAADLLGDVPAYGRTLARLALLSAGAIPAHGLAMARTSDVRRRIESLHRKVFRAPLSRRLAFPALLATGLVVVLIGGFGFTFADPAPAQTPKKPAAKGEKPPAPKETPGRMAVLVTDAVTSEPLEGAEVDCRIWDGQKQNRQKPVTGADGTAVLEYDPAALRSFTLTVRKPRYVPAHVYLDGTKHPLTLPSVKTFALEPGTTIGGIVRDESGQPIEGATVSVMMPPGESDLSNYVYHLGTPKTDAAGRWHTDEAPRTLARSASGSSIRSSATATPNRRGISTVSPS